MAVSRYVSPWVACWCVVAVSLGACSDAGTSGLASVSGDGTEQSDASSPEAGSGDSATGLDAVSSEGTNDAGESEAADGATEADDDSGPSTVSDANLTDTDPGADDTQGGGGDDDATSGGGDDTSSSDAGAGAGDTADTAGPTEPEQAGHPGFEMMLKIASPGAGFGAQVIGAKTTVAGILFGDADEITWTAISPTGAETSGEIIPGAFWVSGPISLSQGDNRVTVTAMLGDEVATDTITITYNPVFRFDERPLARPPVVWAGASTPVVFTIPVSLYPNFDADTVSPVSYTHLTLPTICSV